MKTKNVVLLLCTLLIVSCTSQKKMAYLNNLPETGGDQYFTLEIPDYRLQNRDILYITLKAMNPNGEIIDYLSGSGSRSGMAYLQGEGSGYLSGYNVDRTGNIILPVLGSINVAGKTLEEVRDTLQKRFSISYKNATVECKLLSFKFTVIGEVGRAGTYVNYNNFLTVLEAIGHAGGISDYGKRYNILVVRSADNGTKTYRLNLQDKEILKSEAYFLLPNDVVIVEPMGKKIFNMNLPTISFIISGVTSAVTMTLLIIEFLKP